MQNILPCLNTVIMCLMLVVIVLNVLIATFGGPGLDYPGWNGAFNHTSPRNVTAADLFRYLPYMS